MRVDSVNDGKINFQAKLINNDERIQKFVKSAYRTAGYDTFEILDKYAVLHPDDITISYFSQIKDKKDLQTYLETLRVRVLSHVAIKSINEDTELIDAFNMGLNKVFGTFIQIYLLENNSDFINGDIKFKSKVVSINGEPISTNTPHKYYFSDSSSIGSNLKIGNKRLSMVLK